MTNRRESNAGEEGAAERCLIGIDSVDKLTGIRETLDEIRDDIAWWLKNNRQEQWSPIQPVTSMPKDPLAPDWAERLNRYAPHDLPDAPGTDSAFRPVSRSEVERAYCCDAPDLQWTGDPEFPGVACLNCGYTVADCGTVVMYPAPDAGEEADHPGPAHQQELFGGND